MKETCTSLQEIIYPDDAKAICDCYVDKLATTYPDADMTPDQSMAVLDECSADAKKKAEAESERKMQEMLDGLDASMDSLENAAQ
jgi:polyhydroxyalkanoate synthesis regulator phasin